MAKAESSPEKQQSPGRNFLKLGLGILLIAFGAEALGSFFHHN